MSNTSSLSEYLFDEFYTIIDPENSLDDRIAKAEQLHPNLALLDGYLSICGPCQARLPALDWNNRLRKGYTFVAWIRPRVDFDQEVKIDEDSLPSPTSRVMYRFSTTADDTKATGVCVTCDEWRYHDDNTVRTILTAYAISPKQQPYATFCQVPLTLQHNQWHLVGFSHVFPYLKRPYWTLTVNGQIQGTGELNYPVTEQVMEHTLVLSNAINQGISKTDDHTPASLLRANKPRFALSMDVAALALYGEHVTPPLLALVAEAGPNTALQALRLIPTLPPVANWTKGSSLEGPKVGIPLAVHSAALESQKLSTKAVFCVTTTNARILGGDESNRRVLCPINLVPGQAENAPRVGLMQPGVPVRLDEDPLCLYITGSCRVFHGLSHALLEATKDIQVGDVQSWSLAWQEQGLSLLVMPFFLALPSPGQIYHRHQKYAKASWKQLYHLYSRNGALAAALIKLLAAAIRHGSARVNEEVLQNGLLHILASCLRLSLCRALKHKLLKCAYEDWMAKEPDEMVLPQSVVPHHIPSLIVDACTDLIDACCGPACPTISELSPAVQIRRTSDLALTCLFGFALDFDIWSGDHSAGVRVFRCAVERYGGTCPTSGYVLRSQLSVQFLLDCLRLRYDTAVPSTDVENVATHLSQLLQSILLASLSNKRSISQGENDVSACVAALTDCVMGSLVAHVILNAIMGILIHCEIMPVECLSNAPKSSTDDEFKMHVASRLGRNLLMAQFHDVIAPMLLSRTVFSGESLPKGRSNYDGPLSWQAHWRISLLLFSWVASIAGTEGLIASKSSGSLLLASGLAGSLKGALDGTPNVIISALFLPPPAMALMIGSTLRDEWSYTDLLSDRLQIMMPFLPGMVVSLLSHPSDITAESTISSKTLTVLSNLLTAAGGAFHRVYGGIIHSTEGSRSELKNLRSGFAESIKAARTYVPHLLVVAMLLENHIVLRSHSSNKNVVTVLRPETSNEDIRQTDLDSWVDGSSESVISEVVSDLPAMDGEPSVLAAVSILQSCQRTVLNTVSGLITNAMTRGGQGSSVSLWQNVLATLGDSVAYSIPREGISPGSSEGANNIHDIIWERHLAHDVLCRLIALVLIKSLKRRHRWEVWSFERSAAVSNLCCLIEEKRLLAEPLFNSNFGDVEARYSDDQILLICALLDILEYGRDATGWCQWALPAMSAKSDSKKGIPTADLSEASKLMLPVLLPAFRILVELIPFIRSSTMVNVPSDIDLGKYNQESLLGRILTELDSTLTAAIVGMSFSASRDSALQALAALRRAVSVMDGVNDCTGSQLCSALLCKIADELRERYQAERRLRETAMFDDDGEAESAKKAAAQSDAVERLILGGEIFQSNSQADEGLSPESTSVSKKPFSEDFVLFHDPSDRVKHKSSGLGYVKYEGLSAALESCVAKLRDSSASPGQNNFDIILKTLSPYLDAWDEFATRDAEETELVSLFDSSIHIENSATVPSSSTTRDDTNKSLHIPIHGSQTAADAMSTFFEIAASEKGRLKDLSVRFLPSQRNSRSAFSERFCWARFSEISPEDSEDMWERGISDGNRDIRSRIPTVPYTPQFRRYIPSYLDHSPGGGDSITESKEIHSPPRRGSSAQVDIDNFKTLVKAGNLEIVDITKKQVLEEDELDIVLPTSKRGSLDNEFDDFCESAIETETTESLSQKAEDDERQSEKFPVFDNETALSSDEISHMEETLLPDLVGKGSQHSITSSAFATPPDNASSSLSLMNSAAASMIEMHLDHCLHIMPEGNRQCTVLLTSTHLILEYDGDLDGFFEGEVLATQEESERQRMIEDAGGSGDQGASADEIHQLKVEKRRREVASLRPKSIRFNLSEVSHVYLRRYRLRDSSVELFFIPSGGTSFGGHGIFSPTSSVFLDFGPNHSTSSRRDEIASAIMKRTPPQALKQWPDRSQQFLHDQLSRLTMGWHEGRITNFDYLLHLNMLAGRSYNDICQYPVFPWVLANYTSETVPDLTDKNNFRDLTKPVGALNQNRLNEFLERFNTFADPTIPPFMYGSHYSTSAGVVLHFLVRLHPFAGLHRQLQGGHFDVADRLFCSVPRTWSMCTGSSAAEVKEITPEWYCSPSFLKNMNKFKLGTSQDGEVLDDVALPPWANGSPEKFVEIMRAALESDRCSEMLPDWIDLIFGKKQQGPEAIKANNVFFYLTYYGSVDVASIEDESLREAMELQIAHFGQCPMQLFKRSHVRRMPSATHRLSFFQVLSTFHQRQVSRPNTDEDSDVEHSRLPNSFKIFGEPVYLPFFSAPMSHWVHLDAPPPGPHAPLVSIRLAGADRCLAIDAKGIFHSFRWAWRPDENPPLADGGNFDAGCFIAQRELPRFKSVPRLMHVPSQTSDAPLVVAISKTLFAARSVLLVLSAGDAFGGFGMQLIDPAKGSIRGEVLVPKAHSAQITCIATDPIGTAAGHGGVGGELAIVGSLDGNASIWRFMSSHYLPLRPRVRLSGHKGRKISAVALCSSINVAATLSQQRCCLHSIGNGTVFRGFGPPSSNLAFATPEKVRTRFADTSALGLSVQGYVIAICESSFESSQGSTRKVFTLNLFTIEGVHVGSKPLESWRGIPHKIYCIPDGTAALVCCGRGITLHRISACEPLEIIDEWLITEIEDLSSSEGVPAAFDLDLGPSLNRPVVAAAACSHGALRLHALSGISEWSERHTKSGISQTVGSALATPARRLNKAVREGWGLGLHLAAMGRDVGREVQTDVKEKGMTGFIGSVFRKNNSNS